MIYRTGAFWRWCLAPLCGIISAVIVLAAIVLVVHRDPQSTQTVGQVLACSAIFLALGAACGYFPWATWTARLWLTDIDIKWQFALQRMEIPRAQIRRYEMQGGARMGMIPIQPSSYVLYGSDSKVLGKIPGYFERGADLRAWLEKAVASNA